jgi:hypothetical protein
MIPGFVISWFTFPGVIVHELGHAIFCRLFGLKIYEVCYFRFATAMGQPSGYVVHERSKSPWQDMVVAVGPFIVNTIVGAVLAAPAAIPLFRFGSGDFLDYLMAWIGLSVAMHAFPSTGDAQSVWHSVVKGNTALPLKIIAVPLVGLVYAGALGSMFWLDLLYGVAIAGLLPNLIVKLLA